MSTFAERQPGLYPTRLRGRWGRAWGRAFGLEKDDVVTQAKLAVRSGFIDDAPADALERHGADVVIERLPDETDAAYRARIAAAWDLWPTAGTQAALELALSQLGLTGTLYRPADFAPDTPPRPGWSQWWFYCTGHTFGDDGAWDDAGTWGDGGVWDLDATPEEIGRIRRLVRKWINARDRGHIVFVFETDWWGPETPWDSGTWTEEPAQSGAMVI